MSHFPRSDFIRILSYYWNVFHSNFEYEWRSIYYESRIFLGVILYINLNILYDEYYVIRKCTFCTCSKSWRYIVLPQTFNSFIFIVRIKDFCEFKFDWFHFPQKFYCTEKQTQFVSKTFYYGYDVLFCRIMDVPWLYTKCAIMKHELSHLYLVKVRKIVLR